MVQSTNLTSVSVDIIRRKLFDIGMNSDEAACYLFLVTDGVSSVWDIAEETGIPRTTVYRVVRKLLNDGFVVERVEGKGKKFEAIIQEKFNQLVKDKEQELDTVRKTVAEVASELVDISAIPRSKYKILHYHGLDGLKQVTWNSTKATDTFRIFEIDLLTTAVDQEFAEQMRIEFAKMPIEFHQLTNKTNFSDYTSITGLIKQWRVKHIPEEVLKIQIEMQIYNDVVCMYDYTESDIFIVEIYNQKLADMYKQMFDFYWTHAKNMKILSPFGKAILEKPQY